MHRCRLTQTGARPEVVYIFLAFFVVVSHKHLRNVNEIEGRHQ